MANFAPFSMAEATRGAAMMQKMRDAQAERQRAGALQNLSRMAMQGNERAKQELGAQDPQRLNQLQNAINNMDEGKRKRLKHGFDMQGRLANYIQSAPEPMKARAYQEGLKMIAKNDPDLAKRLPQEYQPGIEDKMFWFAQKGEEMLTNAQRDVSARGIPRSSPEFAKELERESRSGGNKFTMSDRKMELARKISQGEATEEEESEWDLLIQADPIERLMRQMDLGGGGKSGTPDEPKAPPGALPEDEALEILRQSPSEENVKYFKDTYGYAPSL